MSLNSAAQIARNSNQYEHIHALQPKIVDSRIPIDSGVAFDTISSNAHLDNTLATFALQENLRLDIISTPSFDHSNDDEIEIIVRATDRRDVREATTTEVAEKDAHAAKHVGKKKTGLFSKMKKSMRRTKQDSPASRNFSRKVSRRSILTNNTAENTDEESTSSDEKSHWSASQNCGDKMTLIAKTDLVKNVTCTKTFCQRRTEKAAKIHAKTVASMKVTRLKRTELASKIYIDTVASIKTDHQKRTEIAAKMHAAHLAKVLGLKDGFQKDCSLNKAGTSSSYGYCFFLN